jgi:hypothetical protein
MREDDLNDLRAHFGANRASAVFGRSLSGIAELGRAVWERQ